MDCLKLKKDLLFKMQLLHSMEVYIFSLCKYNVKAELAPKPILWSKFTFFHFYSHFNEGPWAAECFPLLLFAVYKSIYEHEYLGIPSSRSPWLHIPFL